jgi:hypothetical protein
MDDRRFDAMVRSLATGGNRRQVLKGLLGFGGAVAAGSLVLDADAARRPTPTPKPVKCPQGQHWNGSICTCDSGETCGSDCCLGESTCCDNACCYGYCYGEELCCPAEQEFCEATGECCPPGTECCGESGCQETCCGPNSCGGECGECEGGQSCVEGLCFWTCTQQQNACDTFCGSNPHVCLVIQSGEGLCISTVYDNQCTAGCPSGGVCFGPYCVNPC